MANPTGTPDLPGRRDVIRALLGVVGATIAEQSGVMAFAGAAHAHAGQSQAPNLAKITQMVATHDFTIAAVASHSDMATDQELSSKEWFAAIRKGGARYMVIEGLPDYQFIANSVYDDVKNRESKQATKAEIINALQLTQQAAHRVNATPPNLDNEIVSNRADTIINAAQAGVRLIYVDSVDYIPTQRVMEYQRDLKKAYNAQLGKPGALHGSDFDKAYAKEHFEQADRVEQDIGASRISLPVNSRFMARALSKIEEFEQLDPPEHPVSKTKFVMKFGNGHGPALLESGASQNLRGAAIQFYQTEELYEARIANRLLDGPSPALDFILKTPAITMDDAKWHSKAPDYARAIEQAFPKSNSQPQSDPVQPAQLPSDIPPSAPQASLAPARTQPAFRGM